MSIIALECCVGFCCTTVRISCVCTYVLSFPPLHPIPQVIMEHWGELPVLYSSFPQAVLHGSVYTSMLPSQFIPLSFPHCVHMSVLYICVSIPALQIGSSVPFFYKVCSSNQKGIWLNSINWIRIFPSLGCLPQCPLGIISRQMTWGNSAVSCERFAGLQPCNTRRWCSVLNGVWSLKYCVQ